MTRYSMTQTTPIRSARRRLAGLLAPLRDHVSALILEWKSRRNITRVLGRLSETGLRDIGLTRADIELACTDRQDHPAEEALRIMAQTRTGNW